MEHLLQHAAFEWYCLSKYCFNPYFYGTSTSTRAFAKRFIFALRVSILIFMEHLLQLLPVLSCMNSGN